MRTAGAIPKVTMSDKESSSLPNTEVALNILAALPSNKSNKQPKHIKRMAFPIR